MSEQSFPLVTYGTQSYSALCYAKMRRESFTPLEVKQCLSGKFSKRHYSDIRILLRKMQQNGLLYKSGEDTWHITPSGVDEIYMSINHFRETRDKILGKMYVATLRGRLADVAERGALLSLDNIDREDAILEEANQKYIEACKRKNNRPSRSRLVVPRLKQSTLETPHQQEE